MAYSRIRVLVSTARPTPAVQTSTVRGQASAEMIPAALIQWIHLVFSAEVEIRGLNRFVQEILFTLDEAVLDITKRLQDEASSQDRHTAALLRPVSDTALSSETQAFVVTRPMGDGFVASDLAALGVQRPVAPDQIYMSDSRSTLASKPFDEVLTTPFEGPNESNNYSLTYFAEDYAVDGGPAYLLMKPSFDSLALQEAVLAQIGKSSAEFVSSNDGQLVFDTNKAFAEALLVTDDFLGETNADDDQTVLFAKASGEAVNSIDILNRDLSKQPSEALASADAGSLAMTDYWDLGYTEVLTSVYVGTYRNF